MTDIVAPVPVYAEHADDAFARTLERVLETGAEVETRRTGGTPPQHSVELLDYQVRVANPRDRILSLPGRELGVVGAVARFVWMVAGNDRLEDIAFYEPKVRSYTDNGLTVPGSSYGQRLFQPRPNLNQVQGVITRLQEEAGSRRGAAVIWAPEDAVRESNDIPCAFGAFYHVRGDRLIATTVMRSNNAFRLLPYNVFEFSLVAEIVAASVGADLDTLVHFAASMHVYGGRERESAARVVEEFRAAQASPAPRAPMPAMPRRPEPLKAAQELARLEAALRHQPARLADEDPSTRLADARARFEALVDDPSDGDAAAGAADYWVPFYQVLLAHALTQVGRFPAARRTAEGLPAYFRASVLRHVAALQREAGAEAAPSTAAPPVPGASQATFDFVGEGEDESLAAGLVSITAVRAAYAPSTDETRQAIDELERTYESIVIDEGGGIVLDELRALRTRVVFDRLALAARSDDADGTSGAHAAARLSRAEIKRALEEIRAGRTRQG